MVPVGDDAPLRLASTSLRVLLARLAELVATGEPRGAAPGQHRASQSAIDALSRPRMAGPARGSDGFHGLDAARALAHPGVGGMAERLRDSEQQARRPDLRRILQRGHGNLARALDGSGSGRPVTAPAAAGAATFEAVASATAMADALATTEPARPGAARVTAEVAPITERPEPDGRLVAQPLQQERRQARRSGPARRSRARHGSAEADHERDAPEHERRPEWRRELSMAEFAD